jgi:formate dehydrogenase iron-sulfur subunit
VSVRVYVPGDSAACSVGADEVAARITDVAAARGVTVEVVRNGSRGMLWLEPFVEVQTPAGRVGYGPVAPGDVEALIDDGLFDGAPHALGHGLVDEMAWLARQHRVSFARVGLADPLDLDEYRRLGGLVGLQRALATPADEVAADILASGLRGRGGAGFPAGIKWRTVLQARADQKYIVCNADEGEPGTFKDRVLLNRHADAVFEGMTIAALVIGARRGLVYLRGEYRHLLQPLPHLREKFPGGRYYQTGHRHQRRMSQRCSHTSEAVCPGSTGSTLPRRGQVP